jgi:hypothetical protein
LRRLRPVGTAHQLDEALAAIDLSLQPAAQPAMAGAEIILGHDVETEGSNGLRDRVAGGAQLGANSG